MTSEWNTGIRGGVEFQWRWCDCGDWAEDEPIPPGTRHVREQVPNTADVEICYYPNDETQVITILCIRGGGGP